MTVNRRTPEEIAALGNALPQPFTSTDLKKVGGYLSKGGAYSQIRRWVIWGWVEHVAFDQYQRTAIFGREKVAMTKQPSPVVVPAVDPLPDIQFCPGCGLNIGMHRTSFRIAKKHSRQ